MNPYQMQKAAEGQHQDLIAFLVERFKEQPLGEAADASPWGQLCASLPEEMKEVAKLAILNFADWSRELLAQHPLNMTSGVGGATLLTIGPDVTVMWPGGDEGSPIVEAGAIQVNPDVRRPRGMNAGAIQTAAQQLMPASASPLTLP